MILSSKMAGYSYFGRSPPPILPPQRGYSKKIFLGTWIFLLKLGKKKKVNFFPLNFWFFTNTRAPKERFKLVFSSGKSDLAKIWPLKVWTPAITWKSSLYENSHQTKTRFRVRSLPGFLGKNGRRIRTQRGPLTPKPPSDFSEQTRVCGFLECTKVYCAVYNKEYIVL